MWRKLHMFLDIFEFTVEKKKKNVLGKLFWKCGLRCNKK